MPIIYPDYIPQRPYGCVIACLRMAFARHGFDGKVLTEERLAERSGLIVPPENAAAYGEKFVRPAPPPEGYGTRIHLPSHSLENLMNVEKLPLRVDFMLAHELPDSQSLYTAFRTHAATGDVMVCFTSRPGSGHVCLLHDFDASSACLIDPGRHLIDRAADRQQSEHFRILSMDELHERIQDRGDLHCGGLWILEKGAASFPAPLPGT